MTLKAGLTTEVKSTLAQRWNAERTDRVPSPEALALDANHAKDLEQSTVLYADLDGSTSMVDNYHWWFSAEVCKAFLRCASQVIKSEGGTITAYDGDRVMAVFTGPACEAHAVRCAMKINFATSEIIQPAIKNQYPTTPFVLRHVVGIDSSQLHVARIGVRGDNDLVWIGRAANYAAKLTSQQGKPTWITKSVYDRLPENLKFHNGINMWQKTYLNTMGNLEAYSSTYWWSFS